MKCSRCGQSNPLNAAECSKCKAPLVPSGDNLLEAGIQALQAGHLDEAVSNLEAVIRTKPGNGRALEYLGIAYSRKGDYQRAERAFKHAINLAPSEARPHYNLGYLYEQRGDFFHARHEYEAALGVDPSYIKARKSLDKLQQQRRTAPSQGYIRCYIHPQSAYTEYCTSCQRPICSDCIRMESHQPYCPQCSKQQSPYEMKSAVVSEPVAVKAPTISTPPVSTPEADTPFIPATPGWGMMKVGLLTRSIAISVDSIIVWLLGCALSGVTAPFVMAAMLPNAAKTFNQLSTSPPGSIKPEVMMQALSGGSSVAGLSIFQLATLALGCLYYVITVGRFGQTPGKMLMHASIVRKDGSPVSYATAFTRWLIQMLIGLPSTIGLALLSRRTMSLVPAMLTKMTTGIGVPDTTDLGYGPLSTLPRPDQLLAPNATSSLPDLSILYLPMAILGAAVLLQLLNACVVAIDSNHQGIHDKIAGTYVVRD